MDGLTAAHEAYESQDNPSPYDYEGSYEKAYKQYVANRTAYHLSNPDDNDLDVLSYDDGQLLAFIKNAPNDLLQAAEVLYKEVKAQATVLAEEEAQETDFDVIMEAL